jgi:hypothetical protein
MDYNFCQNKAYGVAHVLGFWGQFPAKVVVHFRMKQAAFRSLFPSLSSGRSPYLD